MEINQALRLLARKRWLVLAVFVPAILLTEAFTLTQAPVYEATATYVLKLTNSGDITSLDILSRRPEIATTFAEAAGTRKLKELAGDELGLTAAERASMNVSSRLIAGTNLLEISVQGPSPELLRDFIDALGRQTIAYVQSLYGAFTLEPFEDAAVPRSPIRPNPLLNLALGALIGLSLGVGLALVSEVLGPVSGAPRGVVADEATGAFSPGYFGERLRQEAARTQRHGYPLSVALVDVDRDRVLTRLSGAERAEVMRVVASLAMTSLRAEDVVAHHDGTLFAFLLVDMAGEQARVEIERVMKLIETTDLELDGAGSRIRLSLAAGVSQGTDADDLLARARAALEAAEAGSDRRVRLFADAAAAS